MTEVKRFQILVAEDNAGDVELIREALKEHNVHCTLHIIHDGEQAIRFIQVIENEPTTSFPDLIVLDLGLPKYDGQEVLKRLRCTERGARTPVIVVTGLLPRRIEEQAPQNAALFYFQKPSTFDGFMQLGAVIRRILIESDGAKSLAESCGTAGAA